jgi:hypothetical protein
MMQREPGAAVHDRRLGFGVQFTPEIARFFLSCSVTGWI